MSDLCWRCEEQLKKLVDMGEVVRKGFTWIHCHHYPKEKEKCWCERVGKNIISYDGVVWHIPKHCPECGRSL